jgi:hypothetical protein
MKALLVVVALLATCVLLVSACTGSSDKVATGVVLSVDQPAVGQVEGFTLRTSDGQTLTFTVGAVAQGGGAFPPEHLTDHQRTAEPVRVTYRVEGDRNVATKLEDAADGNEGPAASEPA